MTKIYGLAISNYYNKVVLALKHKGIPFSEVLAAPSQDDEFLKYSPMGKIPYLEIDGTIITESSAITEYLEQAYPDGPDLFPRDILEAARCREVIAYIDMYFDAQARRVLGSAFFGAAVNETRLDDVEINLNKAAIALGKIIKFRPYINSDKITVADFSAITTLRLTSAVMTVLKRDDPLSQIDGLSDYYEMMLSLPDVKKVESDRIQAYEAMMKKRNS